MSVLYMPLPNSETIRSHRLCRCGARVDRLLAHEADSFARKGNFSRSLEVYRRLLQRAEDNIILASDSVPFILSNMAGSYAQLGDFSNAAATYHHSLRHSGEAGGETLHRLAWVLQQQGEDHRALEYYTQALRAKEAVFGKGHSCTASTLNNIGVIMGKDGDYTESLDYLKRCLKIKEGLEGKGGSASMAIVLENFAGAVENLGERVQARFYYGRCLHMREELFGKNHRLVGDTCCKLSRLHLERSQHEPDWILGRNLLARASAIYCVALGDAHPISARAKEQIESWSRHSREDEKNGVPASVPESFGRFKMGLGDGVENAEGEHTGRKGGDGARAEGGAQIGINEDGWEESSDEDGRYSMTCSDSSGAEEF
jgi:hypothetical protein